MTEATTHPDQLTMTAPVELQAASGEGKKVSVLAYSGGLMSVPGWGLVAIDLRGIDIRGQVKLLSDHNSTRSGLVGHGSAAVRAGKLYVEGIITQATEAGREIVALAKDGLEFQASVGVEPSKFERVRADTAVSINNQTIRSDKDFTLVTAGKLREVSVVGLGCDGNTSVKIAASRRTTLENQNMPDTINAADIRAAERERLNKIEAMCSGLTGTQVADLKKKAIGEQVTLDELQAGLFDIIKRERETEALRASRPNVPNVIIRNNVTDEQTIAAGMLAFFGHAAVAEKSYGVQAMEQASAIRARTFADIAARCLELEGRHVPNTVQGVINAAFSTYSLPVALGDSADKIVANTYAEAPASYNGFANVVSVIGLGSEKPARIIRPSFMGELQEVAAGGEVKHGSASEETVDLIASTFSQLLSIDRKALINDDGAVFASTAAALGRNAGRKVSDEVWRVVLANGGSFFSQGHDNYISGADTALSVEGLAKAIVAMISQRDQNGRDLDIRPRVLVVPPALQQYATMILSSQELARYVAETADNRPTGNPFKGTLELGVEPRLANDARFQNTSEKHWFLFAGPQDAPVNLGFLNGQRTPLVESFGPGDQADRLAFSWRVVLDFGVGLGDYRAAVKAKGEV